MKVFTNRDRFTVAAVGDHVICTGAKDFSIQANEEGGVVTSFSGNFQVSLDAVNWTTLGTAVTEANKNVIVTRMATPANFFRFNLTAIVLGGATSIAVDVLGID